MPLNFNTLKYIVEVAKAGSVSKAGELFYMSQPHLSNTIRAAEKELGTELFKRSSKGMELTKAGKEFVERAQWLLCELQEFEEDFTNKPGESLKMAVSITRSHQVIRCITDFINENSDKQHFRMNIKETNPFQVMEDVYNGSSNLGILHFADSQKDYFFHQFRLRGFTYTQNYNRTYLLLMSVDNPLARAPYIRKSMLENQISLIYGDYESPSVPYQLSENRDDIYISPKCIHVYDRSSAMDILCRCPNTYAWVTGLHPATLMQYNLLFRKCEDITSSNIGCCIYRSREALTEAGQKLLDKIFRIDWNEFVKD